MQTRRRNFTELRHSVGNRVDLLQTQVDARFVRHGERVQDRVRRAAHRHVERECIFECCARQNIRRAENYE